ncbi:centrosomal protein of 120 kDa-like isoform X1 [Montipora foliosa]|uniref:centrosomal protein of 120 kDa-like isoform X1 n=1 Tax=Montipora foliosa TaxID=591990 RepID=UPI0035F15E12
MGLSEAMLVVVSVLEGRRFPKRPRHKILVETKFDGEILVTDPIDHLESPTFTTELAWELSKKSLHQHRLQRTPIKIQCYALDTLTSQKEPVGYVILDLRTAQLKSARAQWYPLLSTKYQRLKPELKLMLSLEDDTTQPTASHQEETQQAEDAKKPKQSPPTKQGINELKFALNEEQGYYVIGPQKEDNQIFVLSVTIGLASNLAKLIPSTFILSDPRTNGGFYFYYSLLSNDVTNEVFFDLLQPNFPPERASVRLNSTLDHLRAFFTQHSGLEIHLCSGDQSLGRAVVSFQGLLSEQNTVATPAVIEGMFHLVSPGSTQQQSETAQDNEPAVGVSVSLRLEQQDIKMMENAPVDASSPALAGGAGGIPRQGTTQANNFPVESQSPPKLEPVFPPRGKSKDDRKGPEAEGTPPQPLSSIPDNALRNGVVISRPSKDDPSPKDTRATQGQTPQGHVPASGPSTIPSLGTRPPIDPSAHHFCFSVDLRSISNLDVTSPVNCFLRYTYPFFGSSAPVMTSPPVQVKRNVEVLLPKSFCAFDFAASPQLLHETVTRVPLVVEVWHKDNMAGNVLIGICSASLATVLAADKIQVMTQGRVTGYRQIYSERALVLTTEKTPRKIGELHVVLGLEDLGLVNLQQLIRANETSLTSSIESSNQSSSAIPLAEPQRVPPSQAQPPPDMDPRDTAEYKTALELELWKEQQEQLFQEQMQHRENSHMKALADEWKRRDKERELMVKKKLDEYSRLEVKLKQSIADLEKREKQLTLNETQVMQMKEQHEREHERKMAEMREAARRMKEDSLHQVEMERMKVKDLEQQKQRLVEQVYEAEKRYQAKENEFMAYKEQQLTKPEVRLESEINLLKMEKADLERKLETSNKSKIHYKQQWGRALRELARIKQQEQTAARARLKKQEQELEHMRLRYLAAEEKEVVKSEKEELQEIKLELSRLKQQEEAKVRLAQRTVDTQVINSDGNAPSSQRGNIRHPGPTGLMSVREEDEEDIDNRIAKLIEERDTLLHTGVYTTNDRIIVELDKQIRDAIASKGS